MYLLKAAGDTSLYKFEIRFCFIQFKIYSIYYNTKFALKKV